MQPTPPLPQDIWERTPREAQDSILALEARVAALEATVQDLRERLQQHSRTSSRPPSSDAPNRQRPRGTPSGRKPGGHVGHPGHTRTLVTVEEVDGLLPLKPGECARCQPPLRGTDAFPQRHQMLEMPPIKPLVTEYQLHQLVCPACGDLTRAAWPQGVATLASGPRVQAMTARLTGASRLSKRLTQGLWAEIFGLPRSLGTLANLEQTMARTLAEPVAQARTSVPQQATLSVEETGWRQGRERAWLWVAVSTWGTVLVVRLSRGGPVARELLGDALDGIVVSDRWSGSTWYPVRWRPWCWAHLLRDIEAMIERGDGSREIGESLKTVAQRMFHWWHRVRDGTLQRSSFRSSMRPVRRECIDWLAAGSRCGVARTEGVCRELLKRREAWWTFVHLDGVEPTNNAAERSMRPGVLWRKHSCGTHSAQGSRCVEALMTVVATRKQQHRNPLDYRTAACEATLHDEAVPSLLPPCSSQHQAVA